VRPAANWQSVVEAHGQGLPAPNAATPTMKRLTALEAAKHVAMARLTEKLHGTEVVQRAQVRDLRFAGQEIRAEVSGQLRGVRIVESEYDPGKEIAEVTVMVGLDVQGNVVPDRLLPLSPLSVAARRVRAEAAARLDAMARLRQQLGGVRVAQEIRVRNLMLSHQSARLTVEGILEGVEFAQSQWPTEEQCEVEATLALSKADLRDLRDTAGVLP
jgi:hypothetical protein